MRTVWREGKEGQGHLLASPLGELEGAALGLEPRALRDDGVRARVEDPGDTDGGRRQGFVVERDLNGGALGRSSQGDLEGAQAGNEGLGLLAGLGPGAGPGGRFEGDGGAASDVLHQDLGLDQLALADEEPGHRELEGGGRDEGVRFLKQVDGLIEVPGGDPGVGLLGQVASGGAVLLGLGLGARR
ncbi:MAG: hypothetical protein MUF64_17785 [Polyangiaceae bacterium]|nr:hypothetical protein [Polyangiaceae bacterium]